MINYGPDLDNNNMILNFATTYSNRKTMDENVTKDNVLVGSYVLVDYDTDRTTDGDTEVTSEDFNANFVIDQNEYSTNPSFGITGYDSTIWQKRYENNAFVYKHVADLNVIASLGKKYLDKQAVLTSNDEGWISSTQGGQVGADYWITSSVDEKGILSITHNVADTDEEKSSQNNNKVQIPLIKYDSKGHVISITNSNTDLATAADLTTLKDNTKLSDDDNAWIEVTPDQINVGKLTIKHIGPSKKNDANSFDASNNTKVKIPTINVDEKGHIVSIAEGNTELATKDYVDDEIIFTTNIPTINTLGGISAGTNLYGYTTHEILNKLLFPYIAQVVGTPTRIPDDIVLEYGNNKIITSISVKITKKSEPITKVELLKGSEVIATKEGVEVAEGGTFTFSDLSVEVPSTNVVLTVKVTDAEGTIVSKDTADWNFVYPYYHGVCDVEVTIDEALVKGLTKDIKSKGPKTYNYSPNNQCAVIAYPKAYGVLTSVLDPNLFENIASFTKHEVSITGLDETAQTYYVYVSGAFTGSNFKYTFKY